MLSISCQKGLESMLEADSKVVELEFGFDNYMQNIRDKSGFYVIKERNLVEIEIDKNGRTIIEDNFIEDSLIIAEFKKYLIPNPSDKKMPMTFKANFKYSGEVNMHKNVTIIGKYDKELNYEKYREIRNKFYLAYNEVRNEFSILKFNKSLTELLNSDDDEDLLKWREIRRIFPISYMEAMD
jgi:hypothetical protein